MSVAVGVGCAVEALAHHVLHGGVLWNVAFAFEDSEVVSIHDDELSVGDWHHIVTLLVLCISLVGSLDGIPQSEGVLDVMKDVEHNNWVFGCYMVAAETAALFSGCRDFCFLTMVGSGISW